MDMGVTWVYFRGGLIKSYTRHAKVELKSNPRHHQVRVCFSSYVAWASGRQED